MIDKDTIQEIFETARIEDVVGEFVSLKKRGANLLGLCPFHNEKTPSFTVSPKRGIYKCFGCGKGGNAVNFLMEHESFTYPEALKYLAKKYNIDVEEEEQTPEQIKELNEKESLYHVNDFAAKYFVSNLFGTEKGRAIGLSYFKERGFREDIIKKFQLGYSIDEWENFTKHALSQGYKIEYLEKTGLTIVKDDKHYDRFRGRVIFPIHNLSGRVLGFGGRTLSKEKNIPKYVNSPESEIYHKSEVLYGINHAKSSIIGNDNCYLVEGYTDVISLHQSGIENVVASSGTSLTTGQIRLIRRYTSNITILYDGDEAGLKASFRGIDMILEQGMDVKVVLFPEGEDPDSFARSHRTSEVKEFITENARNFILFKTSLLLKEAEGDPIKKAGLIKEIVGSIALIPDPMTRSVYIKQCSGLLSIGEQVLTLELNQLRRKRLSNKLKSENIPPLEDLILKKEDHFLDRKQLFDEIAKNFERKISQFLVLFGNENIEFEIPDKKNEKFSIPAFDLVIGDLVRDELYFRREPYKDLFKVLEIELNKGKHIDTDYLLLFADEKIQSLVVDLMESPYSLSPNWEAHKIQVKTDRELLKQLLLDSVLKFKLYELQILYEDYHEGISSFTGNEIPSLSLQRLIKIRNKIMKVGKALNIIILP